MVYAIIIIVTALAIFLILRDDHDTSYNKNEKGPRKEPQEPPKAEKKASGPSLKDQLLGEIEAAVHEVKKNWESTIGTLEEEEEEEVDEQFPEEELDLSFLDDIDYYEDLEENTETFDITGLRYHCTVHDCGTVVGMVIPEPTNVHDARAQAVYREDGKLLGYIPRTQLDWYEDFNGQNVPCPFVGEIELERSSAQLIAEIKVIIPTSREFVEVEIEDGL